VPCRSAPAHQHDAISDPLMPTPKKIPSVLLRPGAGLSPRRHRDHSRLIIGAGIFGTRPSSRAVGRS
jgi:hypothetical protein